MDYTKEIDYSSLDTYLTCPRKFMFRYMMHLSRTGAPSLDLVFGSCWHYGMELAMQELQKDSGLSAPQLTEIAQSAFLTLWEVEAAPYFDPDASFPKNPGRAHDMFYAFFSEHLTTFREARILGIESPFMIHLKEGFPTYIGRLDLVLLLPDGSLEVIDWKTAKFANDTTFSGYEVSLQTDGYLTAGNLYFDKLPKITYWVALCQKTKIDFYPHTIRRGIAQIDRFLSDLMAHSSAILRDRYIFLEELEHQARDPYPKTYNPPCFRRKPGYACTIYFRRCEYFDICMMRNNPLEWATRPPQGYEILEWHPANVSAEARLGKEKGDV